MSDYSLLQTINGKHLYLCPITQGHKFNTLNDWIDHLSECKCDQNLFKNFICRFNHFHWFQTQKRRVIHETFECSERENCMPHTEVIINQNNEILLPLTVESESELRTYFRQGNYQKRPNYLNFFNQFKEDQVEIIQIKQKKVKTLCEIQNQVRTIKGKVYIDLNC